MDRVAQLPVRERNELFSETAAVAIDRPVITSYRFKESDED